VWSIVKVEDLLAGVHDDHHDGDHVEGNTEDLAVHEGSDELASAVHLVGHLSVGAGGGESNGTEDVHDEVDVDELNGVEAGLGHGDGADHDYGNDGQVAGHLELDEALNVNVDVAAPHDGAHARLKVVRGQDHRGLVPGEGSARAKSERNGSGVEGLDIVDALADDTNLAAGGGVLLLVILVKLVTHAGKTSDKTKLVLGFGASDNLEVANDIVECSLSVGSERVGCGLVFILINLTLVPDDITANLSELLGVHYNIAAVSSLDAIKLILGEDSNVASDGRGGEQVVSRDDTEADVTLLGAGNDVLHVVSQRVLQGNHSEEGLVLLKVANLFFSIDVTVHSVHDALKFAHAHIAVGEGKSAERVDGHPGLLVVGKDLLLLHVVEGHLVGNLVNLPRAISVLMLGLMRALVLIAAVVDDDLWGTLDVDADSILDFGVAHSDDRSLELGVEGDLGEDTALLALHNLVHWDFSSLEPLDKGDLSSVADRDVEGVLGHFDVGLRVVADALNDLLLDHGVQVAVLESVLSRVKNKDILGVEVNNLHLLSRHSASLAKAELLNKANLLDRLKVSDEDVVVVLHEENRVGEGDGHGHGETLRDRDDEHNQSDDDVIDELLRELITLELVRNTLLNEDHDERGGKNDEGGEKTEEAQGATDVVELVGELSLLLTRVKGGVLNAARGVLTDAGDEGLAGAAEDEGVGVEEGLVVLVLVESLLFEDRGLVLLINPLDLVNLKVGGVDDDAVGGDLVTWLHGDDIAND